MRSNAYIHISCISTGLIFLSWTTLGGYCNIRSNIFMGSALQLKACCWSACILPPYHACSYFKHPIRFHLDCRVVWLGLELTQVIHGYTSSLASRSSKHTQTVIPWQAAIGRGPVAVRIAVCSQVILSLAEFTKHDRNGQCPSTEMQAANFDIVQKKTILKVHLKRFAQTEMVHSIWSAELALVDACNLPAARAVNMLVDWKRARGLEKMLLFVFSQLLLRGTRHVLEHSRKT